MLLRRSKAPPTPSQSILVGPLDELKVNKGKFVRFENGESAAVVVLLADGRIVAVDDECCHKGSSLCSSGFGVADVEDLGKEISSKVGDGSPQGGVCIRCPSHQQEFNGGLWFSVVTGKGYVKGKCSKFKSNWALKKYYPKIVSEDGRDIVYLETVQSKGSVVARKPIKIETQEPKAKLEPQVQAPTVQKLEPQVQEPKAQLEPQVQEPKVQPQVRLDHAQVQEPKVQPQQVQEEPKVQQVLDPQVQEFKLQLEPQVAHASLEQPQVAQGALEHPQVDLELQGALPDVPDSPGPMRPWHLKSRTRVNQSTFIFHFVCPDVSSLSFPLFDAWHISLTTSPHGSTPCRDYTPVSSMRDLHNGHLRLLIKIYPQGRLTPKLAALQDGDAVLVGGLEETLRCSAFFAGASKVALVIGGTGITPAIQILENALRNSSLSFWLLYSNREEEDVLMREELELLQKAFPTRLHIYHTLTGNTIPPTWTGGVGRLTSANFSWLFGGTQQYAEKSWRAIACGPRGLLDLAATVFFMDMCFDSAEVMLLDC